MNKKILLIGGGGHCRSVLDSLRALRVYDEIGIIDNARDLAAVDGTPVVGTDQELLRLFREGWTYAFVTLGCIGDSPNRRRLFTMVEEVGFTLPTIVDSSAILASSVTIGSGTYVGKRAVINAGARIGGKVIINTGAIVEHDCVVKEGAHISVNATLCGSVTVGHNAHVGAGSVIRQQISIGDRALIGIGSVVVADMPNGVMAYGNPCQEVKTL